MGDVGEKLHLLAVEFLRLLFVDLRQAHPLLLAHAHGEELVGEAGDDGQQEHIDEIGDGRAVDWRLDGEAQRAHGGVVPVVGVAGGAHIEGIRAGAQLHGIESAQLAHIVPVAVDAVDLHLIVGRSGPFGVDDTVVDAKLAAVAVVEHQLVEHVERHAQWRVISAGAHLLAIDRQRGEMHLALLSAHLGEAGAERHQAVDGAEIHAAVAALERRVEIELIFGQPVGHGVMMGVEILGIYLVKAVGGGHPHSAVAVLQQGADGAQQATCADALRLERAAVEVVETAIVGAHEYAPLAVLEDGGDVMVVEAGGGGGVHLAPPLYLARAAVEAVEAVVGGAHPEIAGAVHHGAVDEVGIEHGVVEAAEGVGGGVVVAEARGGAYPRAPFAGVRSRLTDNGEDRGAPEARIAHEVVARGAGAEIIAEKAVEEGADPHLPRDAVVAELVHVGADVGDGVEMGHLARGGGEDVDGAILRGEPQLAPLRLHDAADGLAGERAVVVAGSDPGKLVVGAAQEVEAAEIGADPYVVVVIGHDGVDGVVVELGGIDQILCDARYSTCGGVDDIDTLLCAGPDAPLTVLGEHTHRGVGEHCGHIDLFGAGAEVDTLHSPAVEVEPEHAARVEKDGRHAVGVGFGAPGGIERMVGLGAGGHGGIVVVEAALGGEKHAVVGRHGHTGHIILALARDMTEGVGVAVEAVDLESGAHYGAVAGLGDAVDAAVVERDPLEVVGLAAVAAEPLLGADPHTVAAIDKDAEHKIVNQRRRVAGPVEIGFEIVAVVAGQTVAGADPQTPCAVEGERLDLLVGQPVGRLEVGEVIRIGSAGGCEPQRAKDETDSSDQQFS